MSSSVPATVREPSPPLHPAPPAPEAPGPERTGALAPVATGDATVIAQRSAATAVRAVDEALGAEATFARRAAQIRRHPSRFVADAAEVAEQPIRTAGSARRNLSGAGRLRRARRWLNRPHRVVLLLLAVWILSAFDLGFTLHQARSLDFHELNPVAARLLSQPPHVLFIYKFALLGASTVIFAWLRRHAIAELGCWLLLATLFYVAVRWFVYYDQLMAVPRDWVMPT